ncbi:MAG: CCDC90 family protein [Magnetococcus sp. DMHC-1]|nr:DUF1640 domain-containing protein [Magnetococcales bacterium]
MNHAISFDTLAFVKELESAGVPSAQAEAQIIVLSKVLQKVEESRLEELATRRDVESAKVDVIKWTAGMFTAQTALIIATLFAMIKMNQPNSQSVAYAPIHSSQEMRLPAPLPLQSPPPPSTPPSTPVPPER